MKKEFKLGKKKIGTYDTQAKLFSKEVWDSVHRFRVRDAWGIDSSVLSKLPEDTKIQIKDLESNIVYECLKSDYTEKGFYYHFKNGYTDHKTQKFLELKNFKKFVPQPMTEEEQAKANYYRSLGLNL